MNVKDIPPLEPMSTRQANIPRWVLPAIILSVLTVGGWFVVQNLWKTSKLEDCMMSGRRNCTAPIDTSHLGH